MEMSRGGEHRILRILFDKYTTRVPNCIAYAIMEKSNRYKFNVKT